MSHCVEETLRRVFQLFIEESSQFGKGRFWIPELMCPGRPGRRATSLPRRSVPHRGRRLSARGNRNEKKMKERQMESGRPGEPSVSTLVAITLGPCGRCGRRGVDGGNEEGRRGGAAFLSGFDADGRDYAKPLRSWLTRSEALWPPKPKLLEMAIFSLRLAGDIGGVVEVAGRIGIGEIDCGGIRPCFKARTVITSSTPPLAPRRCPSWLFVLEMLRFRACSLNTTDGHGFRLVTQRRAGAMGVDVAHIGGIDLRLAKPPIPSPCRPRCHPYRAE